MKKRTSTTCQLCLDRHTWLLVPAMSHLGVRQSELDSGRHRTVKGLKQVNRHAEMREVKPALSARRTRNNPGSMI